MRNNNQIIINEVHENLKEGLIELVHDAKFLLAILNGKKDIHRYVVANIAGSVFALLVTSAMVVQWGLMGALVGFAVYQSLAFFVTLALCVRTPWFRLSHLFGRMDKAVAKNLAKYTAMALTTAATVPLSHILIRNHLGQTLGWEAAGYWEAMWRLSGAYLMLVSTTLSVYYLPRLSELKTGAEIRREILAGYRVILPVAAVCALLVYLLRHFIIETLFSAAFLPMESLFFWQLVGDVFKIASWLFAFVMLGKSMTKIYSRRNNICNNIYWCGKCVCSEIWINGHCCFLCINLSCVFNVGCNSG